MQCVVSGARGFIGTALVEALRGRGDHVRVLTRTAGGSGEEIVWNPAQWEFDPAGLEGVDAVIHLAGESIASGRWTADKKAAIHDSRVKGTRLLAQALADMEVPPQVMLCASAVGFYGDRGDTRLTEQSTAGAGFLAEVCRAWEAAAAPAAARGVRVVHLRFGVVLGPGGGALGAMLRPFKFGLGGRLGDGYQWCSWITRGDAVRAALHCIDTQSLAGPVNIVAPAPVTNRDLTRALAKVLHRPALFPVPAFALRALLGQMAQELLLASCRAEPARLKAEGFTWRRPDLVQALEHVVGTGPDNG